MSEEVFEIEVSARDHRTVKVEYHGQGSAHAWVLDHDADDETAYEVSVPDTVYRAAFTQKDIRAKIARTAIGCEVGDSIKLTGTNCFEVTERSYVVERKIVKRSAP